MQVNSQSLYDKRKNAIVEKITVNIDSLSQEEEEMEYYEEDEESERKSNKGNATDQLDYLMRLEKRKLRALLE